MLVTYNENYNLVYIDPATCYENSNLLAHGQKKHKSYILTDDSLLAAQSTDLVLSWQTRHSGLQGSFQ